MNTFDRPLQVLDCRWLLALYAVVPVSLALVLIDSLVLDGRLLRQHIPVDPMQWPFWTVIFGLPHIVASLLTMADSEYISHYRRSLLLPFMGFAGLTSLAIFGPQPLGEQSMFIFLAFYTIYHVLAQQLGLTLMMMGVPPSGVFKTWKWLSILCGFVIYVTVYSASLLGYELFAGVSAFEFLMAIAGLMCAAVIVLAFRLTRTSRNRIGVWYLWSNVAMLTSVLLIHEIGYTLFVILIPRVIHDITAFMIYITHDTNRNRAAPVNLVYRLTHFSKLPPIIVLPAASIAIAYVLTSLQDDYRLAVVFALTITLVHYYFEGFIWRGGNPHRQHIEFRR
ncbi:hypothetical protein HG264_10820 [Pseudomonas sp. gcc21]|uniref:hypothetical protein n=1 Tax=Pseudomonas sp. gcc21 TaxID=2726989 RepID=UPI0014518C1A|nr:hypothetical protein [Pseudomonas sp. gcc21]QJD59362.1 hypothetical protein HG264_10820 [Pseudomonas sp. gcc21]